MIPISRKRFEWLQAQTAAWRERGLIDEATAVQILAVYDVEASQRAGMQAIVLMAILMCGVGLLLLIGYNWTDIPRTAKLAIIFAGVVAAFGGSAIAYARRHPVVGEALAVAGTLIYGNAIWLIAQVLHISGHFPDAFLWFAIGCAVCAWLVESAAIGVEAALLIAVWVGVEESFTLSSFLFLEFAALSGIVVVLAYRLRSPYVVWTSVLAGVVWILRSVDTLDGIAAFGAMGMYACALYAIGGWHAAGDVLRRAWRQAGLATLCLALVPLMITDLHRHPGTPVSSWPFAIFLVLLSLIGLSIAVRRDRTRVDLAVLLVAVVTLIWTMVSIYSTYTHDLAIASTEAFLFSGLALAVGVALVRTALRGGTFGDLALGVLFMLTFLIVRWLSVIQNLLWSGLLLVATGAGLLLVARLWRQRDRTLAAAGRLS